MNWQSQLPPRSMIGVRSSSRISSRNCKLKVTATNSSGKGGKKRPRLCDETHGGATFSQVLSALHEPTILNTCEYSSSVGSCQEKNECGRISNLPELSRWDSRSRDRFGSFRYIGSWATAQSGRPPGRSAFRSHSRPEDRNATDRRPSVRNRAPHGPQARMTGDVRNTAPLVPSATTR